MAIVLPIHAREGETVEIHWHTQEGKVHHQRVTCPPRATREASQSRADDGSDDQEPLTGSSSE